MNPLRQCPWYHDARQYVLLEFSKLKHESPEGVYITLKQGDLLRWQGVLFVRNGPYSPAILRFQIIFPHNYPYLPPTVVFISDVFHPLVTPLTTYTFTTGSASSETVSASDEERLPPGGFSLGHGFPLWFGRKPKAVVPSPAKPQIDYGEDAAEEANVTGDNTNTTPSEPESPGRSDIIVSPLGKSNLPSRMTSIFEVFNYIKRSFSDESALDSLPLAAAGNAGAWKAWRAYRVSRGASTASLVPATKEALADEWNWDGVWEERVRRGIDNSTSEPVLFGAASTGPDQIRFANLDIDLVDDIRSNLVDTYLNTVT